MINDPIARDFGAVRTPVLSFLIEHELFRIKLNGVFVVPEKEVRSTSRDYTLQSVALRKKMHKDWKARFKKVGWRAGTAQLANLTGRSTMSVHNSLRKLEADAVVVRDGKIPHPGNGPDQIIWKWVRNVKS